jgi:hypothetical protein
MRCVKKAEGASRGRRTRLISRVEHDKGRVRKGERGIAKKEHESRIASESTIRTGETRNPKFYWGRSGKGVHQGVREIEAERR